MGLLMGSLDPDSQRIQAPKMRVVRTTPKPKALHLVESSRCAQHPSRAGASDRCLLLRTSGGEVETKVVDGIVTRAGAGAL